MCGGIFAAALFELELERGYSLHAESTHIYDRSAVAVAVTGRVRVYSVIPPY